MAARSPQDLISHCLAEFLFCYRHTHPLPYSRNIGTLERAWQAPTIGSCTGCSLWNALLPLGQLLPSLKALLNWLSHPGAPLHILLFVIMVKTLFERDCSHSLMAYKRSERHFNKTMVQNRPAYTKAKWHKLIVSHSGLSAEDKENDAWGTDSVQQQYISTPQTKYICVFPAKTAYIMLFFNGNIFLEKKNSPQR